MLKCHFSVKFFILAIIVAFIFAGCAPAVPLGNTPIPQKNTPTAPVSSGIQISSLTPTNQGLSERTPVVFLGDGAPDDITASMYLMLNGSISLQGIIVTNGETHPKIALGKWLDYIYEYMGWKNVQVVAGCDCAVDLHPNQFPDSWRSGADDFWGMPLPKYRGLVSITSGADLIIQLANEFPQQLVVLITGPFTDLALALRKDPTLKNKIKKVSIMGGAMHVPGNIYADRPAETNLVSEWNIWVDAQAASEVFTSGVPIDIIPMDAVPDVHLNRTFADKVKAVNLPGANLMAGLWGKEFVMFNSDQILIWDVLAAIAIDHPDAFVWVNVPVTVVTDQGPDQGRTVVQKGTSTTIRYASHAYEAPVLDALYYVFPPH